MLKKIPPLLLFFCILAALLTSCSEGGSDYAGSEVAGTSTPLASGSVTVESPTLEDAHTADACLNNTRSKAECEDCCDSLEADGADRKTCRNTCSGHYFTQNTDFITVELSSILGPDDDYSACKSVGRRGDCKKCCDSSSELQSGDRRYCRHACNQLPDDLNPTANPPENIPGQGGASQKTALLSIDGQYNFTEGPAADAQGNVYFSDIPAGVIYKWTPDGNVKIFLDGLDNPNGLAYTSEGLLIACEGGAGRLISIDSQAHITVLADKYNQTRFNEPNDLWIDPQGGIYFTDPTYQSPLVQDGEHVYYLTPDQGQVIRVINDMIRPNGIVGTPDGQTLYVIDQGAGLTFVYGINADGSLSNQQLFASVGSDGMTLDTQGNLYLTTPNQVQVFDAAGNHLRDIPTRENPTNVTFGGTDHRTLFITARTDVYTLQMWSDDPISNNSFMPRVIP
jgi:gluconolactonase